MFKQMLWFVTIGTLLISCRKRTEQNDTVEDLKPEFGGTVIFGKNGPPITLDPAYAEETESTVIVNNICDGLVEQRAGQVAIDPALARTWKISPDGRVYTFFLRSGLMFHDGSPVNSSAVILSMERQKKLEPKGGSPVMWKSFNMDQIVKTMRAINDTTVEFELFEPDATFLNILSLPFMSILSSKAINDPNVARSPIGAGPFKFETWNENGTVRLIANDQYWKGRPYLDSLIFVAIPNGQDRWNALKEGRISMMSDPDQKNMAEIDVSKGIKTLKQPGINILFLTMNMKKKPFDNIKVREAINLAINKEALVKEVFEQRGRLAKNPIPPSLLGYNNEIRPLPYDPDRAKKLLTEAGFPKGFKCEFWGIPIIREYLPNPQLATDMIRADLKAVGIETEISNFSWKDFLHRRALGEHQMAVSGWVGDAPDPHFFFFPLLDKTSADMKNSSNWSFYRNEEMHQLITQGKETTDPIERSAIYKKACDLFNRDLPWVTLAHAVTIVPSKDNIMDFQLHSSSLKRFEKVWIKR